MDTNIFRLFFFLYVFLIFVLQLLEHKGAWGQHQVLHIQVVSIWVATTQSTAEAYPCLSLEGVQARLEAGLCQPRRDLGPSNTVLLLG